MAVIVIVDRYCVPMVRTWSISLALASSVLFLIVMVDLYLADILAILADGLAWIPALWFILVVKDIEFMTSSFCYFFFCIIHFFYYRNIFIWVILF